MRKVLGLASLVAAFCLSAGAPANAGMVQGHPFPYISQIFNQQSVLNATGGFGIDVEIGLPQTIYAHASNISSLTELVQLSGLGNSLTIPVFYIDSYKVKGTLGLAYVGDNGVTVLTSYQETLALRPEGRDYATCQADYHLDCYYRIPAVTPSDIPLGWLSSASVVAHEIGHNLGLTHYPTYYGGDNLMDPYITTYDQIPLNPGFDNLTDAQVQTMLQSPFLQNFGAGSPRLLRITPFNVMGIPEPSAWALMIGGFALAGLGLRRRRAALAG